MNADRSTALLTSHLRMAWRAEAIILEAGLSQAVRRAGLIALAGLIGAFGLAALDAAAFLALTPIWGSALAMGAVGLADLAVAGISLAIASRKVKSPQIKIAEELRDQAMAAVDLDVKLAVNTLLQFARNPLDFVSGSVVSLVVSVATRVLKSRRNVRAS